MSDNFQNGDRVIYIPGHANGDRGHPDCERGTVSSANEHSVFVRFDAQVAKFGWDGTTAQGCHRQDLLLKGRTQLYPPSIDRRSIEDLHE